MLGTTHPAPNPREILLGLGMTWCTNSFLKYSWRSLFHITAMYLLHFHFACSGNDLVCLLLFIFLVLFQSRMHTLLISLYDYFGSYMPISGFQGVLSGFLVGIKQIIPDQELPLLKIKAKVRIMEVII